MESDSPIAISEAIGRLRLLESRQESLREKLLIVNNNMIGEYKNVHHEIQTLNAAVNEIKSSLANLLETLKSIIRESQSFAKKDQLKVVEKYINLWNPLHFVSEEEVKSIVKKMVKNGTRQKIS